jgi:hypothetical protein
MAKDKGNGGDFKPIEAGTHHAICIGVIDMGTHFNEIYNNFSHKVLLMWELPEYEDRITIEKEGEPTIDLPRVVSKQYTLSLHEKANLRKDLEAWRGKSFTSDELQGFNVGKLLEANCILNIIHVHKNDKTYANIATIMPLMKGMGKREPERRTVIFEFPDDGGQVEIPEDVPEWIVNIIKKSQEWGDYEAAYGGRSEDDWTQDTPEEFDDDSLPF